MAIFYSSIVARQAQANYVKNNVTRAYLCKGPLMEDSVAQIQAKAIGEVAFASSDVNISVVGDNVRMVFNGKQGIDPTDTATDGGDGDGPLGDDIAVVYCSATENLYCIDAADRDITNETGDTLDLPPGQVDITPLVAA